VDLPSEEIPVEPRLLLLETSGKAGWVALAEGEEVRSVRRLDQARQHARDLAPAVADLLAENGWQVRDLQGVVAGRGPGSYTGLRVGLMSAKALCYATGCALIALDTFGVIASQSPAEVQAVDVLADAQQGKVYVQCFGRSAEGEFKPLTPLSIQPFAEWLTRRDPDAWLSGPALRVPALRAPESVRVVDAGCWDPPPPGVLRLGLARYRAGERDDFWAVEPLYLRPSAAEEQWGKR
jgi:tRNA threonylcarbamoyladenosine biosynthesis protein TsaB